MNRKHVISIGEFYHVYNRGVEKRIIFNNKKDYVRFVELLYICNSKNPVDMRNFSRKGETFASIFETEKEDLVSIGAWCLMPNHFHLLLKETSENGISKFMQKLTTAYTMYFNKKYNRTGSLFQGVFKTEHVKEDRYLKYLFSYIHLNPVKLIPEEKQWKEVGIKNINKVEKFLQEYEYSSFIDYINKKREYIKIINKEEFPEYFLKTKEAIEEIQDWLNFNLRR
jgi:putative transposase